MQCHETTANNMFATDCRFEFLDVIELDGTKYALFLPLDDSCTPPKVITLAFIESGDGFTTGTYTLVRDSDLLMRVEAIFKRGFKGECDFTFDV